MATREECIEAAGRAYWAAVKRRDSRTPEDAAAAALPGASAERVAALAARIRADRVEAAAAMAS